MEMILQPPEWTDRAPVKISAAREIMASPDKIFTTLADHESWPQWFSQLTKIERFGELDEGIGSQRRAFVNKVEIDEEFIEWAPGTVWGFTVTAVRGVPSMIESMNERVSIQQLSPDRCRVTYLMALGPRRGSAWLFNKVLRKVLAKKLSDALAGLDHYLHPTKQQ
ncbi:MAG: SRPBCC family protein [Acidimicrobiales bacterium]|nr:SRPBCC family protein [Acidimicrobiales bacterium]MDG2217788.1 SRPBCC family protein [Acidimicrobiales bacterium]